MSLHKILFFAQGHSLSLLGKPFVQEPAQAWRFGPLYPRVRDALVCFGADDLARKDGRKALAKLSPIPVLSEQETRFVLEFFPFPPRPCSRQGRGGRG